MPSGLETLETGPGLTPDPPPLAAPRRRGRYLVSFGILAALIGFTVIGQVRDWGWTSVATIQVVDREGVIYLADLRLFVVANGETPVALSAMSPHPGDQPGGHRLQFCRGAQAFQGSHGERFDRFGVYLGGPAPRGMDTVAVRVSGDLVQVRPEQVGPGEPRGVDTPQDVGGPWCDDGGPEGPAGFFAEAP